MLRLGLSLCSFICSVQCPVFLTNLEGNVGMVGKVGKVGKVGRVGKVGKVGKEGKEGRLSEEQLPILYQILQQSNKNGEKINEQFCCGKFGKSLIWIQIFKFI
jgi:hypothetical protein